MKISIVIPNYNDKRILRSLNSIKNQSYTNYELTVIHGGPLDEDLKNIYSNFDIKNLIIESDMGIFDALNKGLTYCTGDIIYLLGSDDYLSDPLVFESVNDKFEDEKNLNGLCIGCVFIDKKNKIIRNWYTNSISSKKIQLGLMPPHFSLFLKFDCYKTVGNFKHNQFGNIATDSIWLLDLATAFPNLNIKSMNNHNLFMEYGGSSTKSIHVIIKQFLVIHKYAWSQRRNLKFWFLISPIKSISKVFQFKLF